MINHEYKCILVEVPKTASASIRSIIGSPPKAHLNILQIKNKVTDAQFNEYFKFGFVRNPWDRHISLYKYIIKHACHPNHKEVCNFTGFSEFILKGYVKRQQIDFLSSHDKILVDFIGRFENLQQDFNTVCNKIGIPCQQLPRINKTNHKHYTEYYDNETREIVAEKYARDIEYFGYKFGD